MIAGCSGALVASVALVDVSRSSPGPLAQVHGRVDELDDSANCSACHGGWFQDMAGACLECHEFIEHDLEHGTGLHGFDGGPDFERCASCHGEHNGLEFALVDARSFARAGFALGETNTYLDFDHARLGIELGGAHEALDCDACHEHAAASPLPSEARRFGGLEQRCDSCHEDPHRGRMALDCTSCHGEHDFAPVGPEGHTRWLPLEGAHGQLDCRTCHAEGEPRGLEAYGRGRDLRARECASCHDSPHGGPFERAVRRAEEQRFDASCKSCHLGADEHFAQASERLEPELHAQAGFALDEPHAELECAQCHGEPDAAQDFSERFPGRAADACASCHDDPHGGQFDVGSSAADCTSCHAPTHFAPHEFGRAEHARTGFPLAAAHQLEDCSDCHGDPDPGLARLFRGTEASCASCHADAHLGAFSEAETARAEEGCAACHDTHDFERASRADFDHGLWTGFPLEGAHAADRCEACHTEAPAAGEPERRLGHVGPRGADFADCESCHLDPHDGAFADAALPSAVDGRQSCARCHDALSFRTASEGFDHSAWTPFELDGAHAALDCTACHAPRRRADERGRSSQPARGTACADCHTDPHVGQFDEPSGARADCARCHTTGPDFRALDFNHDRDTRFALDRTHAALECAACHEPMHGGANAAIRYRPLGRDCVDCHDAPRGPRIR